MPHSDTRKFVGKVILTPVAGGSKSAHEAVCLVDARGRTFKLRRVGGNPFSDTLLQALVGKDISGTGRIVAGDTVLLSEWSELPASR